LRQISDTTIAPDEEQGRKATKKREVYKWRVSNEERGTKFG
jgi:hypothetical protein